MTVCIYIILVCCHLVRVTLECDAPICIYNNIIFLWYWNDNLLYSWQNGSQILSMGTNEDRHKSKQWRTGKMVINSHCNPTWRSGYHSIQIQFEFAPALWCTNRWYVFGLVSWDVWDREVYYIIIIYNIL